MTVSFDLTNLIFIGLAIFVLWRLRFVLNQHPGEQRAPMSNALPIEKARPSETTGEPFLLHCPEQGGWHVGVWYQGKWVDHATRSVPLHPDFYMDPPPPLDSRGKLTRPWGTSSPTSRVQQVVLWAVIFLLVLALITLFQNPEPRPMR